MSDARMQPALDLGKRHMALADQRSQTSLNERALPFGNAFHVHAFDKPVDYDKAKRSPVLELLRRHRDANQHIAARRVGLFDRVGGGEDLGDGHSPASDLCDNGSGLCLEFWKAAFDRDIGNGDGEVRSVLRRGESCWTGYSDGRWRTG